MNNYARFEVQSKIDGVWQIPTNPTRERHGELDAAVAYARGIVGPGVDAVRVWGYHATIRGGFGNQVVWDSRDNR